MSKILDLSDLFVFLGVGLVTWGLYQISSVAAALFLGLVFIVIGVLRAR